MARKPIKKALIILESPWWDIATNPNRASVYPFFNGLEKLSDSMRVYHTIFYEANSCKAALDDLSTNNPFDRPYLYIAAHGTKRKLACIHLDIILNAIQNKARHVGVEGVILGSCSTGISVENMKDAIKSCKIVWMMGYRGKVNWMESTLIDLAVFEKMMALSEYALANEVRIFNRFSSAIRKCNGDYKIASNRPDCRNNIPVRKSLSLIIQARGRGHKPRDMSDDINCIWK